MQNYTFRLSPGQDLFDSIQAFVMKKHVQAGCILSGVGSLRHATLRLADREYNSEYEGPFEIVSITGTVSVSIEVLVDGAALLATADDVGVVLLEPGSTTTGEGP